MVQVLSGVLDVYVHMYTNVYHRNPQTRVRREVEAQGYIGANVIKVGMPSG